MYPYANSIYYDRDFGHLGLTCSLWGSVANKRPWGQATKIATSFVPSPEGLEMAGRRMEPAQRRI